MTGETINRRDFMKVTTASTLGTGLLGAPMTLTSGEKGRAVRIAVVGVGGRGRWLLELLLKRGSVVPALCDINHENLAKAQEMVVTAGQKKPEGYGRDEQDYQRLMYREDLDAVVIASYWEWHTPMAVCAMKSGKYAAVEVPIALTFDECWELVNTYEEMGMPCMMLENWSFREDNLAVLNMIRAGLLGEIVHCHCAHSHNCIDHWFFDPQGNMRWSGKYLVKRNADQYHGAVGSAGFLCEAFEHLSSRPGLTTNDVETLQERTFYGKEKKSLAYVIAIMNMILHGIEAPNIVHTNTLAENLADVQDKDRFDVILANPPFGGKERKEIQQNFPIRTGETAYLFLEHFIKMLKAGGRAGIVIKNTFLSNTDNASVSLRKLLLESCNLHTVLDCPSGTFQGAGVKTVVLFFEKGSPTKKVWLYQLDPGRNLGKTNPLNDDDLAEFMELQKTKACSDKSWSVDVADIDQTTFDLSVKNPNNGDEVAHRSPIEILDEIEALDAESTEVLAKIRALL